MKNVDFDIDDLWQRILFEYENLVGLCSGLMQVTFEMNELLKLFCLTMNGEI